MTKHLALVAVLILSAGCSAPTKFITGGEVAPPAGCIDLRARGGRC